MKAKDLRGLLTFAWRYDRSYFDLENERLQLINVLRFSMSTTARAGTIVESPGYYGTNESWKYKDVRLFVVRNEKQPGFNKIALLITLRLLKGTRNKGNA